MIKTIAVGRLTAKIKVQNVIGAKDVKVANFTLACRDGNTTEFVNFTAWESLAETLEKYTDKGSMLYVEGRTKVKVSMDDKTNTKHQNVYTVVEKFEFLDGKKKEESLFDLNNK